MLSVVVVVLVAVPANLIVQPLGSAGTPAAMLGIVLFVWWLNCRFFPPKGRELGSGLQPVRIAIGLFAMVAAIYGPAPRPCLLSSPSRFAPADRAM